MLLVKKLDKNAILPKKGSILAAGHDLFSLNDYTLKANDKLLI